MKKIGFVLLAIVCLQTATLEAIACKVMYPFASHQSLAHKLARMSTGHSPSARVLLGLNWNCQNNNKTAGGNNESDEPKMEKEEITKDETPFVGKIYPNPNDGNMQLDYLLEKEQIGGFEINDVSGKLIAIYRLQTGENTLQINETTLKNGVYFYRIIVDDSEVIADKLIIIK